ncbi:hypothetical protein JCM6882_007196 [Rhodosporidiobolus microsporus]
MPSPTSSGVDETNGEVVEQKPSEAGPAPRKTQRAPVSCSYCAQRKVKCEKVFPCKRCIQKGIADSCKREVVQVKGKVVGGQNDEAIARRQFSIEDYESENKALRRMIRKLTGKAPTAAEIRSATESPSTAPVAPLPFFDPTPRPATEKTSLNVGEHQEMFSTDLTTVGMEPTAALTTDGDKLAKRPREASPDLSYLIPFAPGVTRSSRLRYLLSLVPIAQSRDLVTLSLRLVGWIHGVLLHDVFLQEHDEFLESLRRGELGEIRYEWLSVYFAVLASGAYFLGDSWDRLQMYTPQQRLEFPRAWFSASLETLYLSEFLTRHTLNACQAICIHTLCAFNFGASGHLISLLHVGLRIAQSLGLHILVAEPTEGVPSPGVRAREIGRVIWGALTLGDALSPASQQPHALFLPEGLSVPQANLNQEDIVEGKPLRPHPLSTATQHSKHLFLNHVGRLFRRFNREFWIADTLEAQYRLVEEADTQLLAIVDSFPQLKLSDEPYPTFIDLDGEIPYIRWMQHNNAVNIPRLRMGLYRCFLRKSYEDPRFLKSRQICLDGARAILKERQRVVPALFDRAWHITSDTVAAGVILVALYREERNLVEKRRLWEEVQATISVLSKGGAADNNLVSVGINLLTSYLTSPPPSPPNAVPIPTSAPPPTAPPAPAPSAQPASWQPPQPPLHPPTDPTLFASHAAYDVLAPLSAPPVPHPVDGVPLAPQHHAPASAPPAAGSEPQPDQWAVPDLWSSLELAGQGGAFDPFGGWEGAATLDWSWAVPQPPAGGGGEYDPSRPAF